MRSIEENRLLLAKLIEYQFPREPDVQVALAVLRAFVVRKACQNMQAGVAPHRAIPDWLKPWQEFTGAPMTVAEAQVALEIASGGTDENARSCLAYAPALLRYVADPNSLQLTDDPADIDSVFEGM